MSAPDELFEELTAGTESADQLSVEARGDSGRVHLEASDIEAMLAPGEARSFADGLEEHAREEGWYHAGQTKPLVEEIRETAATVEQERTSR